VQQDWKVQRCAQHCAACRMEFGRGQDFFSALCEEGEGFERLDFCPSCWQGGRSNGFFSFWKTQLPADGRRRRIDVEVVLDLFTKLGEGGASDRVPMRFVLALYLTRRKALKLLGIRREGERELIDFTRPGSEDVFPVENPHLDQPQMDALTESLKDLLQADL